jgi:hypothetical protein
MGIIYAPEIRLEFFENLNDLLEEITDLSSGYRTPAEIICFGDFNCDAL